MSFINMKDEFYNEVREVAQRYINGSRQISRKEMIDALLEYADALAPIERHEEKNE